MGSEPYITNPASGVVTSGDYAGELLGPCNKFSGTMRIPGVELSKAEAEAIRLRMDLDPSEFHLAQNSGKEGTYCFAYENPAMNAYFVESFECSDVNETFLRVQAGKLPYVGDSRCDRIKRSVKFYVPNEEAGAFKQFWDGLWIGGGFAASATLLNLGIKLLTGRSIIDRFRNGKGPKGPQNPEGPGGSPPAPLRPPAPAPETALNPPGEPAMRSVPLPPPEPWHASLILYAAAAGLLAIKVLERIPAYVSGMLMITASPALFEGSQDPCQRYTAGSTGGA